jgi:hypothetical protein
MVIRRAKRASWCTASGVGGLGGACKDDAKKQETAAPGIR